MITNAHTQIRILMAAKSAIASGDGARATEAIDEVIEWLSDLPSIEIRGDHKRPPIKRPPPGKK